MSDSPLPRPIIPARIGSIFKVVVGGLLGLFGGGCTVWLIVGVIQGILHGGPGALGALSFIAVFMAISIVTLVTGIAALRAGLRQWRGTGRNVE